MQELEPAHLVCALLVIERFLVEANIHQAALYRAGEFATLPYLDVLRKLLIAVRAGVCVKTRCVPESDLPPLLDLLSQLPAHMQMQLEQVIEAERRGQATHSCSQLTAQQVREEIQWMATQRAEGMRRLLQ